MRIGIFGGSFNPIHNGHLHLAASVLKQLSLDKVIFVPSNIPPHKTSKEYIGDTERLEMCKLAIEDYPLFCVSDFELTREEVSYSIYTIRHFKQIYPNDELFLMVGSDMLLSFDSWFKYEEIISLASLIAVSRKSGDIEELYKKAEGLSKYGNVQIINIKPLPISSTEIRKSIKNGLDYSCYLSSKVVKYITLKNLYLN